MALANGRAWAGCGRACPDRPPLRGGWDDRRADSIDDVDLQRHGALPGLVRRVRAPSTLGSFLRSFTCGNVLQLQKVHREFLAELARRARCRPGRACWRSSISTPGRNVSTARPPPASRPISSVHSRKRSPSIRAVDRGLGIVHRRSSARAQDQLRQPSAGGRISLERAARPSRCRREIDEMLPARRVIPPLGRPAWGALPQVPAQSGRGRW